MACVSVQCFVPPCPQICDGVIVTDSPQTVDRPVWSTEIPAPSTPPLTYRNPGTYTGGSYPSGDYNNSTVPDYRIETVSLDWWRLVLLALGIVIGATIIKRL